MRAWRIAKEKFAPDRSGTGGTLEGGRWHALGQRVIYAGLSAEIAVMEKLVHTGKFLPRDLVLVELTLPDDPALYEHKGAASLPAGWDSIPAGGTTARTDRGRVSPFAPRARTHRALGHRAGGQKHRINPLHPRFPEVTMKNIRAFHLDQRLHP
jgi:hypothetical protein